MVSIALLAGSCFAQTDDPYTQATNITVVVLGKPIITEDKDSLDRLIIEPLFEKLAKDNNIEPTAEELGSFATISDEKDRQFQSNLKQDLENMLNELKASALTEEDPKVKESILKSIEDTQKTTSELDHKWSDKDKEARPFRNYTAQYFIRRWKINRFLYEKYGGRVIYHPAGGVPIDAYWNFLKEQEKNGSLQIFDNAYEYLFWNFFTNDAMHSYYSTDDAKKYINTPFWEVDISPPE